MSAAFAVKDLAVVDVIQVTCEDYGKYILFLFTLPISAVCSPPCSNGGQCVFPDECRCTSGWQGDTCTTRNRIV